MHTVFWKSFGLEKSMFLRAAIPSPSSTLFFSPQTCNVRRDGKEQEINGTDVVRGDIVIMGTGDIVPADCRLLTSADFKVNEMLLTGEPDDVRKTHRTEGQVSKKR
jgi:P-type E1-E2 ATPase